MVIQGTDLMLFVRSDDLMGERSIAYATGHTLGIQTVIQQTGHKDSRWVDTSVHKLNWACSTDNMYSIDDKCMNYFDTLFKAMTEGKPVSVIFSLKDPLVPFNDGEGGGGDLDRFVATGVQGQPSDKVKYSDDGINWTEATLPSSQMWHNVAFGNGRFVAVPDGSSMAVYSDDGINWTETPLPFLSSWASVIFGNGRWIAFANYPHGAAYSDDGINWTEMSPPVSGTPSWSVAFGNGRFVAVPNGGSMAIYSDDGINWTETPLPTRGDWTTVTYGNGRFVALLRGSVPAAYSDDGINWTEMSMPSNAIWHASAFGNGRFVAISRYPLTAAYSDDGINWTETTMSGQSGSAVAFGNGRFVALLDDPSMSVYSDDGINWDLGGVLEQVISIAYGGASPCFAGWTPIDKPRYTGEACITDLQLNAPDGDNATFSCTLRGTGELKLVET
jgi:hypothetical protein